MKTFTIEISDGTVVKPFELEVDDETTLEELEKGIRDIGKTVCAYCGHENPKGDDMARIDHIMTCEKRPEKKLLEKAFEVEDGLFRWLNHVTDFEMLHPTKGCQICRDIKQAMMIYNEGKKEENA